MTQAITPDPLINWALLGHLTLVSAASGLAVVILFSLAIRSWAGIRGAGVTSVTRRLHVLVVAVTSAAIASTVLWGFLAIIHKAH
ncbi:MAG: hypothetical protein WCG86_03040 [Actinomycetota bacterium]